MCGVVALIPADGINETTRRLVRDLARSIKHRGPDHQAEWFAPDVPVALAHRRLSIVDLSPEGHQPMASSTGRYVISYNGEIYNFEDLRQELRAAGVVFRGRSDTEVFLAAVETWGLNTACQKINGMFAIILYDQQTKIVHLIRDRMGKKPLYVGWAGRDIVVASELKVFMAHPDLVRDVDPRALQHYLRMGYIPAPLSILRGVTMIRPGTRMMIDLGRLPSRGTLPPIDTYWSPVRGIEEARSQQSRRTMTARDLDTLLHTCVRDRMMADVPMGAFLSGGIDSSLVASIMQHQSATPIKTYTIGFDDPRYNEAVMARQIASHLGTDHHEQIMTAQDVRDVIPDLPVIVDEPLSDVSIIPTYLLSRFARNQVTVALTGDGGDELFGGYYRHRAIPWLLRLQSLTFGPERRLIAGLIRQATRLFPNGRLRGQKLASAVLAGNEVELYECLAGGGEYNAVTRRLCDPAGISFYETASWPIGLSAPEWAMLADTLHYLPHDVLAKMDRATMATGLEARSPLLDTRLFVEAWGLPLALRHRKKILRDVLGRYVPPSLFERPKQGFTVPIGDWLSGPLRSWAEDLLSDPMLSDRFDVSAKDVETIWQGHIQGYRPAPETVWRLCMLVQWARHYKI